MEQKWRIKGAREEKEPPDLGHRGYGCSPRALSFPLMSCQELGQSV